MKISTYAFTLAACLLASPPLIADDENEQLEIETYVSKLDKINYLPSLLPVIIENSDVIELSDEQMETLLAWRESNRLDVINAMNDVVQKRVAIKEAALSPDISSARLIQMQNDAFRVQREILEYKLSCRDLVIDTFNRENWEGLYLVLAEQGMGIELPDTYLSKR
jgi:hypothetical protein